MLPHPRSTTFRRRAVARLRSATGAIDLASIMVGVLVIGIIGGVISATVFAVIPWTQDQAALQNLDAVRTAESVHRGLDNSGSYKFADYDSLVTAKHIQASTTTVATTDAAGTCYVAASKSATGKVYWNGSEDTKPKEYAAGDAPSCPSITAADLTTLVGTLPAGNASGGGSGGNAGNLADAANWSDYKTSHPWNIGGSADGQILFASDWETYPAIVGDPTITRSSDGGKTWTVLANQPLVQPDWNAHAALVAVSASGNDVMVADWTNHLAVQVSHDSGATWSASLDKDTGWQAIWMSPNGQTLYATGSSVVYKSTDGGATWATLPQAFPLNARYLSASADGSHVVYFNEDNSGLTLWTSANGGATWAPGHDTSHDDSSEMWGGGAISRDGSLIVGISYSGIDVSKDFGATWTVTPLPDSAYALDLSSDGSLIAVATSGGGYLSTDKGATFVHANLPRGSNYIDGMAGVFVSADGKTVVIGDPFDTPGTIVGKF